MSVIKFILKFCFCIVFTVFLIGVFIIEIGPSEAELKNKCHDGNTNMGYIVEHCTPYFERLRNK